MKKILAVILFLPATFKEIAAATGERSDDYLVILVPAALLIMLWLGYKVKAKLKERRERKAEIANDINGIGNSDTSASQSSEISPENK